MVFQHHGDLRLVRVALTSPAVESKVEPTGTPTKSQGESEEDSMDSNPSLEMIEVDQPYRQLLKETNPVGRQTVCSDQAVDARSETQNTVGSQLHCVCCNPRSLLSLLRKYKDEERRSACGSGDS